MKKLIAATFAAAVVAGCAAPDTTASNEPMDDKVYRTGSNIPERDRQGIRSVSPEEFERARAANAGTTVKDPSKGR